MVTKKSIIAIFSIAMVMAITILPTFASYQQDEINLAYGNNERNTLYQTTSRYETFVYPYAQPFWSELDETVITQTSWVYVPTPNIFSMFAPSAQDSIDNSTGEYDSQAMNFIPRLEYSYITPGVVGGDVATIDKTVSLWEVFQWEKTEDGYEVWQRLSQYNQVALHGIFTPHFSIENSNGNLAISYDLRISKRDGQTVEYGTYGMNGTINIQRGDSFSLEDVLQGAGLAFGSITITATASPQGGPSWAVTDTLQRIATSDMTSDDSYIFGYLIDAINGGSETLTITENGRHRVFPKYGYVNVNVPQYEGQPNLLGFINTALDGFFDVEFSDGWNLGNVFGIVVIVSLMIWILKVIAGG